MSSLISSVWETVGININSFDVHGGAVTFTLTDDANGRFAIEPLTGVVTQLDASQINPVLASSHNITVRAFDGTDATSASFTIAALLDAPQMLRDVDNNANTTPERALRGSRVGVTLLADDLQGEAVFYRLTDDAGGRFSVDPLTGVVTVSDGQLLNFSNATQHTIMGQAIDADGDASTIRSFVINVTAVPTDAPPQVSILPNRVSVVEGDFGQKFINFLVKLNKPATQPVVVNFTTRRGDEPGFVLPEGISANTPFASDRPTNPAIDSDAGRDFFRSTGNVTIPVGATEAVVPVRVQIQPDNVAEPNEFFFVQLLSADTATLAPQQSVAIAQILDDDSVPQLLVSNAEVLEGDGLIGNKLRFRIELIERCR